jgi:hypothetical protein
MEVSGCVVPTPAFPLNDLCLPPPPHPPLAPMFGSHQSPRVLLHLEAQAVPGPSPRGAPYKDLPGAAGVPWVRARAADRCLLVPCSVPPPLLSPFSTATPLLSAAKGQGFLLHPLTHILTVQPAPPIPPPHSCDPHVSPLSPLPGLGTTVWGVLWSWPINCATGAIWWRTRWP